MNYKDVALMDQSFGNLQDSILRSRMMEQQKQERAQDRGFRERELSDREQQQAFERDPNNPLNRQRTAQASIYEDQAKKLGITEVESEWTTQDGQSMRVKGTMDEVKKAAAAAPAKPGTKIVSKFDTKDGVHHEITGTPEQLKAQQDALAQTGGGIQDFGELEHTDSKGNLWLRNPKTGALHPAPVGWQTTIKLDDQGRQIGSTKEPLKPKAPTGSGSDTAKRVTVQKNGKKFTVPESQLQQAIDQGYKRID